MHPERHSGIRRAPPARRLARRFSGRIASFTRSRRQIRSLLSGAKDNAPAPIHSKSPIANKKSLLNNR
jgi:hypothetical protein